MQRSRRWFLRAGALWSSAVVACRGKGDAPAPGAEPRALGAAVSPYGSRSKFEKTARYVNQNDQGRDFGPSNAERRHSLVASGVVSAPFDIQLGAVWAWRSNLPFSAVAGRDLNGDTFVTDFVPGTSRNQGNRDLDLGLVNAWRASLGLAPISTIDSTRFTSLDLRASKSVRVGGDKRAEFVAQLFNVANTVNLSGIGTNATAATFGKASRASAGRQAELAVRFIW